jgi:ligand-binding sensor domain-containing protein
MLKPVIILFLLIPLLGFSQYDPIYKNFTVNDGLAGNETYHVFQDSKGYIWVATSTGVSKFNGYSFQNFDVQSGLVDNIVFEIYEDYKGRIWFIPYSGALSYYEDGKIKPYPYNNKIRQNMPTRSKGPIKMSFYIDSLDNVYLGVKDYGIMHITPEGIFKKFDGINIEAPVVLNEFPNSKILISNPNKPTKHELIINSNTKTTRFPLKDIFDGNNPVYTYAIKPNDSTLYASLEGKVACFVNHKLKWVDRQFKSIIWLSVNDEYLITSDLEGGLNLSPLVNQNGLKYKKILKEFQVTSVIKDSEGSYWVSTLDNGILYIPDIHIQTITKKDGLSDNRIKTVYQQDGNLYLGYQMGWVDMIKDGKVEEIKMIRTEGNTSFVRYFLGDEANGRIWICSFGHLGYLQNNRYKVIESKISIYPRKIVKSKKGNYYWVSTAYGIVKVMDDKVVYDSRDDGFSPLVLGIDEDSKGNVWFTTTNGLWKYSNKLFQFMGDENPLLATPGYDLYFNPKDESLWIGTNGAGIVILDKNGSTKQITKDDGLISNSIYTLLAYRDRIWVGTRQGLSIISHHDEGFSFQNLTSNEGLISNDIASLYVNDSNAYIGTSSGLSIINLNKIKPNLTKPNIYITSIEVADSTYNWLANGLNIPWDTKYARISYEGLSYKNMGKALYRYRLLGLDSNWVYTSSTQCLYSVFKPGSFTFEVEVQNSNGIWSSPASLSITVNPPYWQRIWFIILLALAISGFLYLIYFFRMGELKRRNELINNINLYKQQSLRQQMNPHFIFNTLNSIQYYILEKDTISSHKYLTKFARLMRYTLDNSLHSAIPLRDELESLRLYLELEALRLQGNFTYDIDYQNNESVLDIKIPTLMIQPFVENAIWHGIMLKPDKSGRIQITIRDMETSVLCTIEDNGVGREQAKKIQETTNKVHRSRGFQITQQRIDLLNSMYGQKFNIQIVDLYSHDGIPQGTRVTINIPKGLEST